MTFEVLKPTTDEIRRMALDETDPRGACAFDPIARGPLVALAILLFVGVASAVLAPFRLLLRIARGSR